MSFDWKSVIGTVAPTIATALGGPLAGAAVGALSQKFLGKPNGTEDELAPIIAQANPETLLKLKEVDKELKLGFANAGIKLEEISADDRASARDREIKTSDSWSPRILAALVLIAWFSAQYVVFNKIIDPSMRDFAMRLLGTMDGAVMLVLSYYFGSSAGSANKNDLLSKALDK